MNQLRRSFNFKGTPIVLKTKAKGPIKKKH
jgi:predicted GTPase